MRPTNGRHSAKWPRADTAAISLMLICLSDGEDIVAVRLVDREEIFRTKDPLPKLDAWQEVYKFMLEKGVIDGFDYFSRCDSDLALRIPAYRAAREAAESDLETLQKKFI